MTSQSATENAPTAPGSLPARLRALRAAALDRVMRGAGQRRMPDIRAATGGAGMACLAMMAAWHGRPEAVGDTPGGGAAQEPGIADMARLSHAIGLHCRPRHVDADSLEQLELPCILAWTQPSYVVLAARAGRHWLLHDPAIGPYEISTAALVQHSRAVVLEFPCAERSTQAKPPDRAAGTRATMCPMLQRRLSLPQCLPLLALAALAELAWLALPVLLMLLVDRLLIPGDFSSLPWLAVASFTALAVRGGLEWVLHHALAPGLAAEAVIRLARGAHTGDRWGPSGAAPLQDRLQQAAAALLSLGLAALLDWWVAMATLAVLALHGLLVRGARRRCAKAAKAARDAAAESNLRGRLAAEYSASRIALKRAGVLGAWQARLRRAGLQAAGSAAELSARMAGERALQSLLLAWFAGQSLMMAGVWVQAGHSSAGAMLALLMLTWRAICAGRPLVASLCGAGEAEPSKSMPAAAVRPEAVDADGVLALRALCFRHAASSDWLIRGIDLQLKAGEAVVVAGASGAGKTSLLRLLLGEIQAPPGDLQGEIRLAATPGCSTVAAVMEDDVLLPGSVAENIARFAAHGCLAEVEASARAACAHEDIMALPAAYETQVEMGGASLPRGLVKRLLLARALHGRPKLLLLDEATAMLEPAMERALLQEIALQGIACLVVSRRLEASANMRVLRLEKPRPAS